MNNMRRLILLFSLLSLMPNLLFSQKDKLAETSNKEKPEWIGNRPMGSHMVKIDKAESLSVAEIEAINSLINKIASSVAISVISTTETTTKCNDDECIRRMESVIKTKVGKMPAIQGISLTKAEVYWERYVEKKSKQTYYVYYILYPFPDHELDKLIDEYNKNERAVNDKIDNFKTSLPDIDNTAVLLDNIAEMKTMLIEYKDDDEKCIRLDNIISLYEKVFDNIYVDVVENSNGLLLIQLKHDEKVIKTNSLPQLRGECARDFNKRHKGDAIEIKFNTFDCYEQDDNYVDVRFNFGKKRVIKKICIKL